MSLLVKYKFFLYTFLFIFTFQAFSKEEPQVLDGLWDNTKDSFSGDKTWYHLAGIGLTPVFILTGTDASVNHAFDDQKSLDIYRPGAIGGVLAPALLGAPLYLHGKWKEDNESLRASYAVLHSTVITLTYISLLKAFTGRPAPDNNKPTSMRDQSEEFNFGFLERGINYGWPSGHMGTTMALVSTMTHYYPDITWIKWVGYGTAAYMFSVVVAHEDGQFHWFSDAVAGTLMGYAIGSTVGTNFRSAQDKEDEAQSAMIFPIMGRERTGVQVVWNF